MKVKVIRLPLEGLTADKLEGIIRGFIETEKPTKIHWMDLNSEFGYLTIVYET